MLKPQDIVDLYTAAPALEGSERLAALVAQTLRSCRASRERCAHLAPLFEGTAPRPAAWDVYLAHVRWAGGEVWRAEYQRRLPQDAEGVVSDLGQAAPDLRWGLVEAALETARSLAAPHPKAALALARGATRVAGTVPTHVLGVTCRDELVALGLATVGNAYRVLDKLAAARRAMERAEERLEDGSLLGLRPAVLSFKVSLERWERKFLVALATVEEALNARPAPPLRSRLLLQESDLLRILDDSLGALQCLEEASTLVRREDDPRTFSYILQHRLLLLTELQRFEEAVDLLETVREALTRAASDADLRKLHWVEARIAVGLDELAHAHELYARIHEDFLNHELPFSAAVVTLEWCRLLLTEGRLEEVKQRATVALTEFHRQKVEPEIVSAVALVQEAVLAEKLTEEILRQARRLLDRQR